MNVLSLFDRAVVYCLSGHMSGQYDYAYRNAEARRKRGAAFMESKP